MDPFPKCLQLLYTLRIQLARLDKKAKLLEEVVEVPDIPFPTVDIDRAASEINNALKEAAYIAVGLGVLGFQRAQVRRVEAASSSRGSPTPSARNSTGTSGEPGGEVAPPGPGLLTTSATSAGPWMTPWTPSGLSCWS